LKIVPAANFGGFVDACRRAQRRTFLSLELELNLSRANLMGRLGRRQALVFFKRRVGFEALNAGFDRKTPAFLAKPADEPKRRRA